MIRVTRLDRQEIAINCDLIESIEARPDTTIRLVGGQSLVVREALDEILERIADYRGRVLGRAGLGALLAVRPRDLREPDDGLEDLLELEPSSSESCATEVEEAS